jgi:murein DD-endopeptidase MepM/ murein hydrolase activator NlpD
MRFTSAAACALVMAPAGFSPATAAGKSADMAAPANTGSARVPDADADANAGSAEFSTLLRQWRSVRRPGLPGSLAREAKRQPPAGAGRALVRGQSAGPGRHPLTSGFGLRAHPLLGGVRPHLGVDLAAQTGTPVRATADGVVSLAGARGGYGLAVELQHVTGMQTRYGHLSRIYVALGQRVRKGDVIGLVGSTGRSTGPHLHYETRRNGQAVDPTPFMRRR